MDPLLPSPMQLTCKPPNTSSPNHHFCLAAAESTCSTTIGAETNLSSKASDHQGKAAATNDIQLPRCAASPMQWDCGLKDVAGADMGVMSREVTLSHDVDHTTDSSLQMDKGDEITCPPQLIERVLTCAGIQLAADNVANGDHNTTQCRPSMHLDIIGSKRIETDKEEEEDCVTPTEREQRIPEETSVCPAAPKKKKKKKIWPSVFKRTRPNFYRGQVMCDDTNSVASHHPHVAEPRAFLVDPPDVHNFPECIRALFK